MKCLAEADKDRRIAVFGKNNEGPGAARNLALRKATGDYIYFFDIESRQVLTIYFFILNIS